MKDARAEIGMLPLRDMTPDLQCNAAALGKVWDVRVECEPASRKREKKELCMFALKYHDVDVPKLVPDGCVRVWSRASRACLCRPRIVQHLAKSSQHAPH